jgi:hypothetical protein
MTRIVIGEGKSFAKTMVIKPTCDYSPGITSAPQYTDLIIDTIIKSDKTGSVDMGKCDGLQLTLPPGYAYYSYLDRKKNLLTIVRNQQMKQIYTHPSITSMKARAGLIGLIDSGHKKVLSSFRLYTSRMLCMIVGFILFFVNYLFPQTTIAQCIAKQSIVDGTFPNLNRWSENANWAIYNSGQAYSSSDYEEGNLSQSVCGWAVPTGTKPVLTLNLFWRNGAPANVSAHCRLFVKVNNVIYAQVLTPDGPGNIANVYYYGGATGNRTSFVEFTNDGLEYNST